MGEPVLFHATWCNVPWYVVTWRGSTSHVNVVWFDMVRCDVAGRGVTRRVVTWYDVMSRDDCSADSTPLAGRIE